MPRLARIAAIFAVAPTALILSAPVSAADPVLDPIFANSFESGLIAFGPALSLVSAPSTDTLTVDPSLSVTLSEAADAPTFVSIVSSNPAQLSISGGGVTVALGQTTAAVPVSTISGNVTPVTLWAKLGNTIGASVRVVGALNESNVAAEADYCNIQYPVPGFQVSAGSAANAYGRLFEAGVTETDGPPPGWTAQFGYGPDGTDPRLLGYWTFIDATYNAQVLNDDEFQAAFNAPVTPGNYLYTFRFSNDGGGNYTYCDTDGAGSNSGLTFSPSALGQMVVNPP